MMDYNKIDMRRTACMVYNQSMADMCASRFNCTTVSPALDCMEKGTNKCGEDWKQQIVYGIRTGFYLFIFLFYLFIYLFIG